MPGNIGKLNKKIIGSVLNINSHDPKRDRMSYPVELNRNK